MNRVFWFLPLGALTLVAGVVGFRYGWHAATLTETDVITTYAARYSAETGGAPATDCFAEPGDAYGVWIVVRCVNPAADSIHSYYVNRLGGLSAQDRMERADPATAARTRPQT